MRPIEIEIIPVSADRISVSLNYNVPGSIPMIRRWQIEKATVDEICESVSEIVGSSLSGTPADGTADEQRPDGAGPDGFENAGRTFFEALFREQCDRLRSTTRTGDIYFLFKVDRTLAYLPFEILHDGEKFLSKHFAFGRVVYSESPAHTAGASEVSGNRALILGDPSEDPAIRDDVEREVDSLRDLFKKSGQFASTIATGREVSERMILSLLPETALLHFTGHGCEAPDGTAGLELYAGRVLTQEAFRGVQHPPAVAFFNTCSTASHEAWRSPLGIMEALISRGTLACIAPVWDVASGAATSVALSFYTHLLRGDNFGEALRRARVEAVEAGDRADRTWAAYALYGDPASVLTAERAGAVGRGAGRIALRAFLAVIIALLLILAPKAIDRDTPSTVAPVRVGYVILESEPADARIFLDGEEVGLTPTAIEVSVGKHQVAIMKRGYRRWQVSIDVKESPETVVRATLQEIDQ
jgi:hypothetical protein